VTTSSASMSKLRHSRLTNVARWGLRQFHRLKYRNGAPFLCTVAPGFSFKIYPRGELTEFLSLGPLFERTEMKLVASLLKPGMKVVDAGANIGLYSLLAAKCVGEGGRIWSFEPSQTTYGLFLDNLALNGVTRVAAHRLALSDSKGELILRSEQGFGDLYRHLDYMEGTKTGDAVETVRVIPLDDFADAQNIGPIDFLKIDVEGGEFCLLKGARRLLSQSPNVIVMFESEEDWCQRSGCKPEDSFELLKGLGFRLYSWSKRQQGWVTDERQLRNSRTVWAARSPSLLDGTRT
jgi:FkbM family methyltransferase